MFQSSITAGLSPDQFWAMTPFMTGHVLTAHGKKAESEQNRLAWHTWHVAALTRCKKMPALKKFISPVVLKKTGIDEADIIRRLKGYNDGPSS